MCPSNYEQCLFCVNYSFLNSSLGQRSHGYCLAVTNMGKLKIKQAEVIRSLQRWSSKALSLLEKKMKREQESSFQTLREKLGIQHHLGVEELKKISNQAYKDLRSACAEIGHHKTKAKKAKVQTEFSKD
ncbi:hypothetical protein ACH5RR_031836 [Cinchona calisaya]|uniref:Uncharacterized protein n=1 Tax=Cinchona calisaya TaxID=153742 RepID=A0ABD2YKE3_9GENT